MGILCGNFGIVWALGAPLDDTQNPSIVALLTAVDQGNQKHKIADTLHRKKFLSATRRHRTLI